MSGTRVSMVDRLDHLVLTVRDIEESRGFYVGVLGMTEQRFGDRRVAFCFGQQKLNIHEADGEAILPRAKSPTPGSADVCLIADRALELVVVVLEENGIEVELGPVDRQGAL